MLIADAEFIFEVDVAQHGLIPFGEQEAVAFEETRYFFSANEVSSGEALQGHEAAVLEDALKLRGVVGELLQPMRFDCFGRDEVVAQEI